MWGRGLDDSWTGHGDDPDLLVVSLPGVQRFIAEARTTSDVASASAIYSALAGKAVDGLGGSELVLPGRPAGALSRERGMPNRIVALAPAGAGAAVAQQAAGAVRQSWQEWVSRVL